MAAGLDDFLILGLPNIGRFAGIVALPAIFGAGPEILARNITRQFNLALQNALISLQASQPVLSVQYFDTFSLFEDIIANAAAFGFGETTTNCLDQPLQCLLAPDTSDFYDGLYPTETVHAVLAESVRDTVTAIPLSTCAASLLTVLALFGGIGQMDIWIEWTSVATPRPKVRLAEILLKKSASPFERLDRQNVFPRRCHFANMACYVAISENSIPKF